MKYSEFLDNLEQIDEQRDDTNDQVAVIMKYKDRILCAKNGKWSVPLDHLKFLEPPESTASRDLSSELNINIDESKLTLLSIKLNDFSGKIYLYLYQCNKNEISNIECTDKYIDIQWNTIENIPESFDPIIKQYIHDTY